MSGSSDDLAQARKLGKAAYHDSFNLSTNPYSWGSFEHIEWCKGWMSQAKKKNVKSQYLLIAGDYTQSFQNIRLLDEEITEFTQQIEGEYDGNFKIVIYLNIENNIGFVIPKEAVKAIAESGKEIDVDLYFFPD